MLGLLRLLIVLLRHHLLRLAGVLRLRHAVLCVVLSLHLVLLLLHHEVLLLLLIKSGIHLAWHRHHRLTAHLHWHLHWHLHSWWCHLLHGLLRHHLLSHHLLLLLHCHLLLLLLHRNSLILWLISILIQLILTELWSSGTLQKFILDICSMRHSSTSNTWVGRLRTCFSKKWNLR